MWRDNTKVTQKGWIHHRFTLPHFAHFPSRWLSDTNTWPSPGPWGRLCHIDNTLPDYVVPEDCHDLPTSETTLRLPDNFFCTPYPLK